MDVILTTSGSEPSLIGVADTEYHIDRFPAELLLNVFSLLPPRDLLEVREVCRRWAQVLSVSSPTFSNSITFTLSPGTDAYSALLSSGADWKHVKVTGLMSSPESQNWFHSLAIRIRSSVRRLVFGNSVFTQDFLQSSLLGFPHLEELEFINSEMSMNTVEAVPRLWKIFLRTRLKKLTLVSGKGSALGNLFKTFTCQGTCLRQLVIRINSQDEWYRDVSIFYRDRIELLFGMIRNSCSNLRHFSLTTPNDISLQHFWTFFRWNSSRMNLNLRLQTFELICTNPDSSRISMFRLNRFLQKFSTFLRLQPDLKSVSVPPVPYISQEAEELVASLPDHLETIHVGCVTAFQLPQFFLKLERVKNMTLHFFHCQFIDFRFHLLGQVLPKVESLTVFGHPGRLVITLVNSFPNLRKLVITCSTEKKASAITLIDSELQLIIVSLTGLTVLKLSSSASITDFGVAGIGAEEAAMLLHQRTAGLNLDLDALQIVRKGAALQDLQGLEELSFEGSSQISDVGIRFGLGFKDLRQLDLATAHRELTAWGLVRLTKLNPKLERIHVESSHLADRGILEKVVVTELQSNGRWKRLDVSLRAHSEEPLKKVQLRPLEKEELTNILHILHEIKTYDNKANNSDTAAHHAHPAEVYRQWRDDKIALLKAGYPKLNQAQKDLLSTSEYTHLF